MNERERVLAMCHATKVGQRVLFTRRLIENAFPQDATGRPTIDAFTENLMGANYGAFRVEVREDTGDYVVSRHEPQDQPVRRDFDRRHIPLPTR